MIRKGWRNEGWRHSLASRGIKTNSPYFATKLRLDENNHVIRPKTVHPDEKKAMDSGDVLDKNRRVKRFPEYDKQVNLFSPTHGGFVKVKEKDLFEDGEMVIADGVEGVGEVVGYHPGEEKFVVDFNGKKRKFHADTIHGMDPEDFE